MSKKILTIEDMMEKFQVKRNSIYRWMKMGMPSLKISGVRRFDEDAVMAWVAEQNETAARTGFGTTEAWSECGD